MEKLYGIYSGCKWEGGGCRSELYSSKEIAREVILEEVKELNKGAEEQYEWECNWNKENGFKTRKTGPDYYVEKSDNYFSNEYYVICIQEFNLVK